MNLCNSWLQRYEKKSTFAREMPIFLQLHFFRCVVRLDGLGLDDAAGVTFLPVLAGGCHRARHVAAREGYCRCDYRRKSYHDELFHTAYVFSKSCEKAIYFRFILAYDRIFL